MAKVSHKMATGPTSVTPRSKYKDYEVSWLEEFFFENLRNQYPGTRIGIKDGELLVTGQNVEEVLHLCASVLDTNKVFEIPSGRFEPEYLLLMKNETMKFHIYNALKSNDVKAVYFYKDYSVCIYAENETVAGQAEQLIDSLLQKRCIDRTKELDSLISEKDSILLREFFEMESTGLFSYKQTQECLILCGTKECVDKMFKYVHQSMDDTPYNQTQILDTHQDNLSGSLPKPSIGTNILNKITCSLSSLWSGSFQVNKTVVGLKEGYIVNLKEDIDVIVNEVQPNINLSQGAVSAEILAIEGSYMTDECRKKAPDGLNPGEILVYNTQNLNPRYVYNAVCWDGDKHLTPGTLQEVVSSCLSSADQSRLSTIAFPTIGTSRSRLARKECAFHMFKAIVSYLENNPQTSLQHVLIVMHRKDKRTHKPFEDECKKCRKQYKSAKAPKEAPSNAWIRRKDNSSSHNESPNPATSHFYRSLPACTSIGRKGNSSTHYETPNPATSQFFRSLPGSKSIPKDEPIKPKPQRSLSVPDSSDSSCDQGIMNGKNILEIEIECSSSKHRYLTLEVYQGDLLAEGTDIIVHSTNDNLSLRGAIGGELLRRAGGHFKQECSKINGLDFIILTTAGELPSRHVMHVNTFKYVEQATPAMPRDMIVRYLEQWKRTIKNCLKRAESNRAQSIAFPCLGTGKLGYEVEDMAHAFKIGITDFIAESPKCLNLVRIVCYDEWIAKNFQEVLEKISKTAPGRGYKVKKIGRKIKRMFDEVVHADYGNYIYL